MSKVFRRIINLGLLGAGTIFTLALASSLMGGGGGEDGGVGRVPFAAVKNGVDMRLAELSQEKQAQEEAAQQAVADNGLSAAHNEVLLNLAEFEEASGALACVRQQAITAKLQAQKEQGISFEQGLTDELAAMQRRWQAWQANTNGALAGDALRIAEARALVGDSAALLKVAEAHYSRQAMPACQEDLAIEVYNLGQAAVAVAASFEQKDQLVNGALDEKAIQANWLQFQRTGNPQYKANIQRLASQSGADLASLGIDLDSIAEVAQ